MNTNVFWAYNQLHASPWLRSFASVEIQVIIIIPGVPKERNGGFSVICLSFNKDAAYFGFKTFSSENNDAKVTFLEGAGLHGVVKIHILVLMVHHVHGRPEKCMLGILSWVVVVLKIIVGGDYDVSTFQTDFDSI